MTNRDEELAEILEKINDIRKTAPLVNDAIDSVTKLLKEELDRKKVRQTGPAIGQKYWFVRANYTKSYTYDADDFDLNVFKFRGGYPEERFAEAELRAMQLIQAVNNRRRELNEGKEFEDRQYYIEYWDDSGSVSWESTRSKCARGVAYPFGLFKDSADCKMCVREFADELEWYYKEYLPLMEELDDYDWADAPGWRE